MGAVSNFESTLEKLPKFGYRVILPMLPLYSLPVLKTNVNKLADFINNFIDELQIKKCTLLGNSLGGHIGLILALRKPNIVKRLILSGSSGLYENSMGDSYPKREDYSFIRKKTEGVFYNPKIATKEIVWSLKNLILFSFEKDSGEI